MKVSIRDAKAHFSQVIDRARAGETVVVCRRNEPIAEIRGIGKRPGTRLFGEPLPGLSVPESFFEPLPGDVRRAFWLNADEAAD